LLAGTLIGLLIETRSLPLEGVLNSHE
jgi:hypothetical protein